jgi:hypothetical protein
METKTYLHGLDEIRLILNAYKDVQKSLKKYQKLSIKRLSIKVYESLTETAFNMQSNVIDLIMNADISEQRKDMFIAQMSEIEENPFK